MKPMQQKHGRQHWNVGHCSAPPSLLWRGLHAPDECGSRVHQYVGLVLMRYGLRQNLAAHSRLFAYVVMHRMGACPG